MKLLGLIFDNLGVKLLALVMAWAVWFMTRESLMREIDIPMEVDVVVLAGADDEVEARPNHQRVNITITGTARAVADFEKLPNPKVVVQVKSEHFPPDGEWMRTETFVLSQLTLPDAPDASELRAIRMQPNVIEVRIDSIGTEELTVEPPLPPKPMGGAEVRIIQTTPKATVRGTLKNIDAMNLTIKTAIDADAINALAMGLDDENRVEDRIDLQIHPSQQGIFKNLTLVEPRRLSAKVEVSNRTEHEIVVPVRIFRSSADDQRRLAFHDLQKNDLEWTPGVDGAPATIKLRLEGSPRAIGKIVVDDLEVFVLGSDMPADGDIGDLPLRISGLPVGVGLADEIDIVVRVAE